MTARPGDPAATRVLLVDDQTLVRQGIRGLLDLAEGVEVVGEAGDGEQALALLGSAAALPDVVLLDLRMPGLGGLGVLGALADRTDAPPVLVLTTFDDDHAVLESLRLGARGFLLKDVTLDDLTGAIRTVAEGGLHIQPAVTERLLQRAAGGGGASGWAMTPSLTPRERDILRLLTGGYSNREIATALHLAEGTVKNHVSNLLVKLGVRDRTRAALRGIELGLVSEPR